MTRLVIAREGKALPVEILLPAMSLRNFSEYVSGLSSMMLHVGSVVTEMKLCKATNAKGTDYSQAQFRLVGIVDIEAAQQLKACMEPLLLPAPDAFTDETTEEDEAT